MKPKSSEEKSKDVGQLIRDEVKAMDHTFHQWPPQQKQLLELQTEIPPLLFGFLATSLSSKANLSNRKKRQINSIGQVIIYIISGGQHHTSKHVQLSLCTKRKTGSKDMVKWLNRFGHRISYDKVSFVEAHLAEEATNNQLVKSYCPSLIQPSLFVTFVWDNNDINPESLTGKVMHCTNGIIMQLQSEQRHFSTISTITYLRDSNVSSYCILRCEAEELRGRIHLFGHTS